MFIVVSNGFRLKPYFNQSQRKSGRSVQTQNKKQRFQLSIRGMLLITFLCAVASALFSYFSQSLIHTAVFLNLAVFFVFGVLIFFARFRNDIARYREIWSELSEPIGIDEFEDDQVSDDLKH